MEPREYEIEVEEEFLNRTGIMSNPGMSAELIRGTEELTPRSDEDAAEIVEMRAEYLAEVQPIGSEPLPVGAGAEDDESSEPTEATRLLLDKLGERLAFERQGTRLYEAFLQKFKLLAFEGSEPTAADLRHICDEEFEHFKMLHQAIVKLGGDATVQTPCADIAGVLSKGIVEIVGDPRTTLPQCLQALITAELVDNDGWQMLGELAAQLGLEELAEQCRTALKAEQDHLEKVRQWLLSATLETTQEESAVFAEMEAEESEEEVEARNAELTRAGGTDALKLLKHDHEKVKELFERAESAEDDKQQRKIFKEVKKELETHARIEETIFYPAMQEFDELQDMVIESIEEHKQVKKLLREIDRLGKTSNKFAPILKVLQENVAHHAEEEEEGKMFPKIRKLVDPAQLQELGNELKAAKNKRQRKAS